MLSCRSYIGITNVQLIVTFACRLDSLCLCGCFREHSDSLTVHGSQDNRNTMWKTASKHCQILVGIYSFCRLGSRTYVSLKDILLRDSFSSRSAFLQIMQYTVTEDPSFIFCNFTVRFIITDMIKMCRKIHASL